MDEQRRWEVATHEAGHAAAVLLGGIVRSASIVPDPDDDSDGRVCYRRRKGMAHLDDNAIFSLAGRSSVNYERHMRGEAPVFSMPDGTRDDESVSAVLRCLDPEVRRVHLEELEIRADILVRSFDSGA